MAISQINGHIMHEMFSNGYRNLCRMEQAVNDLNVFPVPDGDTGSNMLLTLSGGVLGLTDIDEDISAFMKKFARAVLLSARGNSGVILSQFIQGLAQGSLCKDSLSPSDMYQLLSSGTQTAYKAVIKPTEGTMLTVIREASEAMQSYRGEDDFISVFTFIVNQMNITLKKTPDLLPVLKEAGVVDSGAVGLIYIIEGMLAYLKDEIIEADSETIKSTVSLSASSFGPDSRLEYGYCTEFILQLMNYKTDISSFDEKVIIDYLGTIGDSIVCVKDSDIVKVHVHTFTPEKALAFARNFGEFVTVKIENMSVQHSENTSLKTAEKKKKFAIVAVASGIGFKEYFTSIGADITVDGGQTQNPSAQDFISAFNSLNAENIIVLPNNSNIVLTAVQAAQMYEKAPVHVIKTKSMAEGYSALSMINPDVDTVEEFIENMSSSLPYVTTGCISRAIHDANMNGITVTEGDYIGIANGKIVSSCTDRLKSALSLIDSVEDISDKEVITIFYGEECTEADANELLCAICDKYPLLEGGIIYGGQKVYDFYMAIE